MTKWTALYIITIIYYCDMFVDYYVRNKKKKKTTLRNWPSKVNLRREGGKSPLWDPPCSSHFDASSTPIVPPPGPFRSSQSREQRSGSALWALEPEEKRNTRDDDRDWGWEGAREVEEGAASKQNICRFFIVRPLVDDSTGSRVLDRDRQEAARSFSTNYSKGERPPGWRGELWSRVEPRGSSRGMNIYSFRAISPSRIVVSRPSPDISLPSIEPARKP